MTIRDLPRRKKFPTHGPWDREVCGPATGLTTVRRDATLAMVTWLDKVLGWLSGLSQPTAKRMAHMGARWFGLDSTEVWCGRCARLCWGWVAQGSQRGLRSMESQIWVASPGNGAQRSAQGCAIVRKRCADSTGGCAHVRK